MHIYGHTHIYYIEHYCNDYIEIDLLSKRTKQKKKSHSLTIFYIGKIITITQMVYLKTIIAQK